MLALFPGFLVAVCCQLQAEVSPARGAPREQYHRRFVLYHESVAIADVLEDVARRCQAGERMTFGWSADDAGIGDLEARDVLLVGFPAPAFRDYELFFARHYWGCVVEAGDGLGLTVPVSGRWHFPRGGRFDAPRDYPFAPNKLQRHEGEDFTPSEGGALALAPAPGRVAYVGYSEKGYGHYVILEHKEPRLFRTYVAHMSRIVVSEGEPVARGQVLGPAGMSGNSSGIHVHLTVQEPGRGFCGYVIDDVVDPEWHVNYAPLRARG